MRLAIFQAADAQKNRVAEFDPPPLFVDGGDNKDLGMLQRYTSHPILASFSKSGGGFNSQTALTSKITMPTTYVCSLHSLRKLSVY
ncbi:MAG: hypothetical protein Q8O30_04085 [Candidatus Omnitrophota bacterium]|nr:hypothetical protein [Candidatus Omnitrophota bacterium]